jgi:DNA-binding response OmpR family regulator|tara:strand:+ start:1412 stop:2071 length:660 start_codon:yes stop_codon:yes gene_type:complete
MGKSTIPFIFENSYLNNIFVEAESCANASKLFYFQNFTVEKVKKNNLTILVSDNSSLTKIVNQDIKPEIIFLVNDLNQASSNLKISSEVININVPFKMGDIYRRIENYLIQIDINNKRIIKYKNFSYDPSTRKLINQFTFLRLTEKESQIFNCLMQNTDSYITKKDLLNKVWSYGDGIDTHTLETHIYALRKKIDLKLNIKNLVMFEEKKGYYINKEML